MKVEFGSAFVSAIAETLLRLTSWFGCFWTAATIAFASSITGHIFFHGSRVDLTHLELITAHPDIVTLVWALPGALSWAGLIISIRRQEVYLWTWCGITIVLSLLMLAVPFQDLGRSNWSIAATSTTWLVMTAGVVTLLWFIRHWQLNRWAVEMEQLKTENAMRRLELKEQLGTDSAGVDETGIA